MRTFFGERVGFELRRRYKGRPGRRRVVWVVFFDTGEKREASHVEARLWLSLPGKMRGAPPDGTGQARGGAT